MRRIRSPCCARAVTGHAAAPPSSDMNSRLLLRNSIQKTPVESMIAVSSIRVRSAHGNSLDHLVGARGQRGRDLQAEDFCGLQIDDEFEFAGLLDRKFG